MKSIKKTYRVILKTFLCLLATGLFFQSCEKNESFRIDAFGPSEVERGGDVWFIGADLGKVQEIILPDSSSFTKGQFILESSEKIILHIPGDYPLDITGKVILKLSDGTEYTTISNFHVLSKVVITGLEPAGSKENPLNPGDEITITGKTLMAADTVIFSNGVKITDFIEHTDTKIRFNLPGNAPSGVIQLGVPAREAVGLTYIEGPAIFVLEPIITDLKSAAQESTVNVPVGSEIIVSGTHFDRIDVNPDGTTSVIFPGGTIGTGTVSGDELKITIPTNLMVGEDINVTVLSNGVSIASTQTFSVITPVVSAIAMNGSYVQITGENLNAIGNKVGNVTISYQDNGETKEKNASAISITPTGIRGYVGSINVLLGVTLQLQSGQIINYPPLSEE